MGELRNYEKKHVYEHTSYGHVYVNFTDVLSYGDSGYILALEKETGGYDEEYRLKRQDGHWEISDNAPTNMLTIQIPQEDAEKIIELAD